MGSSEVGLGAAPRWELGALLWHCLVGLYEEHNITTTTTITITTTTTILLLLLRLLPTITSTTDDYYYYCYYHALAARLLARSTTTHGATAPCGSEARRSAYGACFPAVSVCLPVYAPSKVVPYVHGVFLPRECC